MLLLLEIRPCWDCGKWDNVFKHYQQNKQNAFKLVKYCKIRSFVCY